MSDHEGGYSWFPNLNGGEFQYLGTLSLNKLDFKNEAHNVENLEEVWVLFDWDDRQFSGFALFNCIRVETRKQKRRTAE